MGERRITEARVLEIINGIRATATVARCLDVDDVAAFIDQARYEDAFMPLFDPTLWMRNHRQIALWCRAAEAFLAFRREVEAVSAELVVEASS